MACKYFTVEIEDSEDIFDQIVPLRKKDVERDISDGRHVNIIDHISEDDGDLFGKKVEGWTIPNLSSMHIDKIVNGTAILNFLNKTSCAIAYTDAKKIGARYLNVLVQMNGGCKSMASNYGFRKMRESTGMDLFKTKCVKNLVIEAANICGNCTTFLGSRSDNLKDTCVKPAEPMYFRKILELDESARGAGFKLTKFSANIQKLIDIMMRYRTTDYSCLYSATRGHPEFNVLQCLNRHPMWESIYKKASIEYHLQMRHKNEDYYSIFMTLKERTTMDVTGNRMMSVEDTQKYIVDWCDEQKISPMKLFLNLYIVMRKIDYKINGFYMQGESNAGKSYFMSMIMPYNDFVGHTISSRDFAFQECVYAPVISIGELTLAKNEKSEIYKNVIGGEAIKANIKNRSAEWLFRKPVFITSNDKFYKNTTNGPAFENRMFSFTGLTRSRVVERCCYKGQPNIRYLQEVFRNIQGIIEENKIYPGEIIRRMIDFVGIHKVHNNDVEMDVTDEEDGTKMMSLCNVTEDGTVICI